jgi:hypothetical protein
MASNLNPFSALQDHGRDLASAPALESSSGELGEVMCFDRAGLSSALASRAHAAKYVVADLCSHCGILDEVRVPIGVPRGAAFDATTTYRPVVFAVGQCRPAELARPSSPGSRARGWRPSSRGAGGPVGHRLRRTRGCARRPTVGVVDDLLGFGYLVQDHVPCL